MHAEGFLLLSLLLFYLAGIRYCQGKRSSHHTHTHLHTRHLETVEILKLGRATKNLYKTNVPPKVNIPSGCIDNTFLLVPIRPAAGRSIGLDIEPMNRETVNSPMLSVQLKDFGMISKCA